MQAEGHRIDALFERIVTLEDDLAPRLQDRRKVERLDFSYVEAGRRWSAATWAAAEALGPATLAREAIARGGELAPRPIFVCGAHRSGTTLLRDLLDGHPALAVLPFETGFYSNFRPRPGQATERQPAALAQEWLRRLVNPNNQPPFWLLGRSTCDRSSYVALARAFLAWRAALDGGAYTYPRAAELVAFALAYASQTAGGALPPEMRMWVEKTPTNEQWMDEILADFPEAKILHLIRRPDATFASHKALLRQSGQKGRALLGVLGNLARSYATAVKRSRTLPSSRYRLVRYEDLVRDPGAEMAGIADFLGIEPLAVLHEPTVTGLPASMNSSYPQGRPGSGPGLSRIERDLLALTVGDNAALLGFDEIEPGSPAGRALRGLQRRLPGGGRR